MKLGKNNQKSLEMHVFMLIQTKSGKFYWKAREKDFLPFLMKLEKNHQKS